MSEPEALTVDRPKRRCWPRWAVLGVIAVCLSGLALLLREDPQIRLARNVRFGMTAQNVQKILGAAPRVANSGDHTSLFYGDEALRGSRWIEPIEVRLNHGQVYEVRIYDQKIELLKQ